MLSDHRNEEKDREKMGERVLIGSPDTFIKRVEAYSEAGVTDFECLFVYRSIDDLIGQMKLLMDEVAPSISIRPQGVLAH